MDRDVRTIALDDQGGASAEGEARRPSVLKFTATADPWRQKTIYEYTRRDAPDSYEFPKPLFDFFLQPVAKYVAASDATRSASAISAKPSFSAPGRRNKQPRTP
ncbi:MAG TPA: hypothetical protein VNI81_04305 [Candidatus Limnocylindrales bacterium]|nr:hypothetical protein [Candidatus Limnocylindrales bacterium]